MAAEFPFSDLHSFKDYVVFVQTYLPDRFRPREGAGHEDQWTLNLAIEGLRLGLAMAEAERVSAHLVQECRNDVEKALECYKSGDVRGGFYALEHLSKRLKQIRTH